MVRVERELHVAHLRAIGGLRLSFIPDDARRRRARARVRRTTHRDVGEARVGGARVEELVRRLGAVDGVAPAGAERDGLAERVRALACVAP